MRVHLQRRREQCLRRAFHLWVKLDGPNGTVTCGTCGQVGTQDDYDSIAERIEIRQVAQDA